MGKVKYYYDTEELAYKKIERSKIRIFKQILLFLVGANLLAFSLLALFFTFFDSLKEKELLREIEQLEAQYKLLDEKITNSFLILDEIQDRDDNIYRVIFEADPIDASIRKAGFGGVNRYKEYEGFSHSNLIIDVNKKVDQLSKAIYVQSKSFDEVLEMVGKKEEMLSHIPAIQPVSNKNLKRMASGYGYRIHPIYKTRKMHWGMDFSAPKGTPVYATGNGKISKAIRSRRGYGNQVRIDHGYGYETFYAHLNKFTVKQNQKVFRGDLIGYIGNSGTSTAPHLHYEVVKDKKRVNPVNYYFNDLTAEEFDKMLKISSQENQSFD
ncbi:MAG: peptidase M23 [Flavobacteriales bacterium]|nr:peptidase M23 [Flavobacteriales bacterium]|tara:strand:+ start:4276 stop:5247 length:972 start_codon:yes stop_codon:yes gene_type:complete